MNMKVVGISACLVAVLWARQSNAQSFTNRPTVLDAAGGGSAGGGYSNVAAVAQSGGTAVSSAGAFQNYAGFLGGFILKPTRDTDHDGLADEMDSDNDADGLGDTAEIDGSAFSGLASTDPNREDSDGDGMGDAEEAAGLYDPNDPQHHLVIVAFTRTPTNQTLAWIGKGGGAINTVMQSTNLAAQAVTGVVSSASYGGGFAPWYKVTNTYTWPAPEPRAFYQVRTTP